MSRPMAALSEYMSLAYSRPLPAEVTERVKEHILDTFAAMISGSALPPGQAALKFAHPISSPRSAMVVGAGILCDPAEAALINGIQAHADETDDSHAPSQSHPGCAVLPAALAAGEILAISGEHFMRAVALGYDVGTRVTMALSAVDFQARTHRDSHSHAGVFGAAAAAACAAKLDVRQMRWVLDYTAQQASGIAAWKRDVDHIEKAFVFAGMPARNGLTAALVVESGWTGVDDIFSGSDNFFLANAPAAEPAKLADGLGTRFEVSRTNIKKWSVGSPIQAPLDALELLMEKNKFTAEDVRRITVRLAGEEAVIVDSREMPDVCLQHMLALLLVDRGVSFRSAHDRRRMQDPAVLRMRSKVTLVADESLEKELPKREAIVDVVLNSDVRLTQRVDAVRGTAENPMSREEITEKCRDLMSPILGTTQTKELIARIFSLEAVENLKQLRPVLSRN